MFLPTHKNEIYYGNDGNNNQGIAAPTSYQNNPQNGYMPNTGVCNNYQSGPWINPSGYLPVIHQNNELRSRSNSLRLPQAPVYNPYTNSYNYSTSQVGQNGISVPNNLPSPGLKEVLATCNSGNTFLYLEPKNDAQKSFQRLKHSPQTTKILLVIAALVLLGTCTYLTAVSQSGKATVFLDAKNYTLPLNPHLPEDLHTSDPDTQSYRDEHGHRSGQEFRSRRVDDIKITVTYSKDDDEEAEVEVVLD